MQSRLPLFSIPPSELIPDMDTSEYHLLIENLILDSVERF